MEKLKTAVLISGRGSNLQALIDQAAAADAPFEIALVVSNVPGAKGLAHAKAAGLSTATIDHRSFDDRQHFEDALHRVVSASSVQLICLAGFMRILSDGFVNRWRDRLINIHPSLLPAFRGLHVHERVIAAGVRFTGCTVHFVRPAMDEGPIIVQAVVPVFDDDNAIALAARVLQQEHRIYPLAVRLFAEGRLLVRNERVAITDSAAPAAAEILINPPETV